PPAPPTLPSLPLPAALPTSHGATGHIGRNGRHPRCREQYEYRPVDKHQTAADSDEARTLAQQRHEPATSASDAASKPDRTCSRRDRKSTRLNSSHVSISYAV